MKISIHATLFALALGFAAGTYATAEEKPAEPAPAPVPAPAPEACAELFKKYEELDQQAAEVCPKEDEASEKQCDELERQLQDLEEKLDEKGCDSGEEDGGQDEE